ncbi:hypothetical protein VM39_06035 [Escherichia coli]|nr:hypothetical protein VM39_06035 [Escherichia coli]
MKGKGESNLLLLPPTAPPERWQHKRNWGRLREPWREISFLVDTAKAQESDWPEIGLLCLEKHLAFVGVQCAREDP